jgi:hypothetical protein
MAPLQYELPKKNGKTINNNMTDISNVRQWQFFSIGRSDGALLLFIRNENVKPDNKLAIFM